MKGSEQKMSEEEQQPTEVPEQLRQSVKWDRKPNKIHVRNVQTKQQQKMSRKPKKGEQRYAYMEHVCPKCKKKSVIEIPEQFLQILAFQAQQGFKPDIPEGMSRYRVRRSKTGGVNNR